MNIKKDCSFKEHHAIKSLIHYPKGWVLFDILVVIAHLTSMIILGSPIILIAIFYKIQKSPYSLTPSPRLIFVEDIIYYISSLPLKLIEDVIFIKVMLIIAFIFAVFSIADLVYYYYLMEFPQERCF